MLEGQSHECLAGSICFITSSIVRVCNESKWTCVSRLAHGSYRLKNKDL